jgi:asparagine synthase (glutamine-hydrolysing)
MPGIVAVIDGGNNDLLLKDMANSIRHEPWHKTDIYFEPPVAIARVHLGIDNPEPQPIFSQDRSLSIFMDGKVFGYEEEKQKLKLRNHKFAVNNDPEYCLHLYEEYGEEFLQKLDGNFVIVIYDTRQNKIIVANDRHSLRPLYFARIGTKYVFSSEVKAFLRDKEFGMEIDDKAIGDFFAFGRIFGEKTFFKGVRVVKPASIFVWSEGELLERQYWRFRFKKDADQRHDEEYYARTLAKAYKTAVVERMKGKHDFGVFLSGGLDSRCIVGAVPHQSPAVSTYTYGIKGGDEARLAEKVARKRKTRHKFIALREDYLSSFAERGVFLTDGMLNCMHFHWISVLPQIREYVDVMFHGSFQDVFLGTYLSRLGTSWNYYDRQLAKARRETMARLLYTKVNDIITDEMMPKFFSEEFYRRIKNEPLSSLEESLKDVEFDNATDCLDSFFLRQYGRYHLSYQILRNYVEDRIPGSDNDFVDLVRSIPAKLRSKDRMYYRFLTELSPDLARIPYQKTGLPPASPLLAHKIGFVTKQGYKLLIRKLRTLTKGKICIPDKMGYPDLGEWIRKNRKMRKFFQDVLLDKRTLNRPYFKAEFITRLVDEHMQGKKDYTKQLCTLLTFELWHRIFIDSHLENTLGDFKGSRKSE